MHRTEPQTARMPSLKVIFSFTKSLIADPKLMYQKELTKYMVIFSARAGE